MAKKMVKRTSVSARATRTRTARPVERETQSRTPKGYERKKSASGRQVTRGAIRRRSS